MLPPLRKAATGARAFSNSNPGSDPNPNPSPDPDPNPNQVLEPSSAQAGRGTAHGASSGGEGARSFFPCSRQGRLQLPLPPPLPAADEGGAIAPDGLSPPGLAARLAAAPAASRRPGHSLAGHGHSAAQPCAASASGDAEAGGAEAEAEAEAEAAAAAAAAAAGAAAAAAAAGEGGVPAEAAAQWLLDEFGAQFGLDSPRPHPQ